MPILLYRHMAVVSYRNSTSNHNSVGLMYGGGGVVSYRNSTSNHNLWTTKNASEMLYLIEIPHQTTTKSFAEKRFWCCILSKFHIKPQQCNDYYYIGDVVSYRNSTSNHNQGTAEGCGHRVVSYRNSTSNHNAGPVPAMDPPVVSYRNSTSNHNVGPHID